MRILVADDDYVNRIFLEKILKKYGETVLVDNGMSAVEVAIQSMEDDNPFDLICLDIMMTKLDGFKTLEAIREAEEKYNMVKDKKSKVVMISALDEFVMNQSIENSDYDAYLCKPIVLDEFDLLLRKFGYYKLTE